MGLMHSIFDGNHDELVIRDILVGVASALMVILLLRLLKQV